MESWRQLVLPNSSLENQGPEIWLNGKVYTWHVQHTVFDSQHHKKWCVWGEGQGYSAIANGHEHKLLPVLFPYMDGIG